MSMIAVIGVLIALAFVYLFIFRWISRTGIGLIAVANGVKPEDVGDDTARSSEERENKKDALFLVIALTVSKIVSFWRRRE